MVHFLKTDPILFQAAKDGTQKYQIRKNDRRFAVGDQLWLQETTKTGAEICAGAKLEYTGQVMAVKVTHILHGPIYGLMDEWCIMSIAPND